MKTTTLLFVIFMGASMVYCDDNKRLSPDDSSVSDHRGTQLYSIPQNGKWGYIDKTGKIVIKPQFDFAYNFASKGLGPVNIGGKWGFINAQGKIIIAPQFDAVCGMSVNSGTTGKNSLSGLWVGGKWGLIDKTGKIILPIQYNAPLSFGDGLAPINIGGKQNSMGSITGGKWGFIDKTGKTVIEPKFDKVYSFFRGFALANIGGCVISKTLPGWDKPVEIFEGGKWGFIDTKGKFVISPRFEKANNFTEGLAIAKVNGKWGYIDKTGKFVIEPQYDLCQPFTEGLAYVANKEQERGFVDKTGKFVIKLDSKISLALPFSDGMAMIIQVDGKSRKCGFIDKSGKVVIPLKFTMALPFQNGLARVTIGSKVGYIDKSGKYVWKPTE